MKYLPYIRKSKHFKFIAIGFDRIFSIRFYKDGFMITLCYFGSIRKKYELEVILYPFEYRVERW